MNIGRNDPCYCGSGKKYKKCHMLVEEEAQRIADLEWEEWFAKDCATGAKKLAEAEVKAEKKLPQPA